MDLNSPDDLKRLEKQIFQYKPSIKSAEKRKYVSDQLRNQLLNSKAVVKIQRMDAECENLIISLKQRLMLIHDFLIPNDKGPYLPKIPPVVKDNSKQKVSSDSSDNEILSSIMPKEKNCDQNLIYQKDKEVDASVDTSEPADTDLPLALRRKPRERRLSYKSISSSSTSHFKTNSKNLCNKQEHTVSTTDGTFNSEEITVEQELDSTPTLHIKIPSLHRGNVHYIILDSLNFARTVFDYRANQVKQQQQQQIISHSSKISKSIKKPLKCSNPAVLQQLRQQEHDLELSQLIQDVMAEACNDETLQATSALENINNNLINNYDIVENDEFINYSQSTQELSFSQNSSVIDTIDTVYGKSEGAKIRKTRKNAKRSNECKQNEPPKKRGRKPKNRNSESEQSQPQPPTKSNLAQYVELFSNDCELLPGSTTPAASSTKSQPLVSSTTHNYEVAEQSSQQQGHKTSQQPITYYIDGDWANGGPCQLVTTNGVPAEERQPKHNDIATFQDFANYINYSSDSGNNVITTVVENNNSLPISIPRSIANATFQNKNIHQLTHQIHHQPTVHNSLLPIINIQIPPLPTSTRSSEPPPAHTHKEVVDLSVKSKANAIVTESFQKLKNPCLNNDDECLPLDLSALGSYSKEKLSENNFVIIDTQDEEFIRRLIEQSDFDYRSEEITKLNESESSVYDSNKAIKASLDMPLLDFDASEFVRLVDSTGATSIHQENILTDNIIYNDSKSSADSNYISMTAVNTSVENNLHFTNQSATDIFNSLMDISPENRAPNDVNNEFIGIEDLNESTFDQCKVKNSTMCEIEKLIAPKNQSEEKSEDSHSNSEENNKRTKNTSNDHSSSPTSLGVQLDSSNIGTDECSNLLHFSKETVSSELEKSLNSPNLGAINKECVTRNNDHWITEVQNCETISKSGETDAKTNCLNNTSIKEEGNVNFSTLSQLKYIKCKDDDDLFCSLEIDEPNGNTVKNTKTPFDNNENNTIAMETVDLRKEKDDKVEHLLESSSKKYAENVVFSVAKITLSEDDPLYAIDSDFSSVRSCDLSEFKSTKKDEVFVQVNSESENKALNLCNNEVENFQNVETKTEESVDSSKYLDFNKDTNVAIESFLEPPNSNTCNENLTLLELESKLEGSLDFDEDFDDALSLDTSCFDSPNDERFEDSIVNIDTENTTNTPEELRKSESQSDSSQIKDLKHFKIPKLSSSADSMQAMSLNKLEEVTHTVLPQNLEKITRTVKNDFVYSNPDADISLAAKELGNETTIAENVMLKVFGINCLPFLVDKCCDTTHCQLSHKLNDAEKLYQNLNSLDRTNASLAYKMMYNHSTLFKTYFKNFCIYYTNKNDRTKLLNMANDCERYPEHAEFIIVIYEGLVKCGLNRVNACRLILKRVREKSISTPIVEALVAIIMQSDWTMFTDFIEKYTEDVYQYNFRICTLEQMAEAVLNGQGSHLKQVFGKCVQTLHRDDSALLLNSPILIQCVALLTTST